MSERWGWRVNLRGLDRKTEAMTRNIRTTGLYSSEASALKHVLVRVFERTDMISYTWDVWKSGKFDIYSTEGTNGLKAIP